MTLDPATATLLGTVVGGSIAVVGKTLSDWLGTKKDREARKDQFRADAEKWQRERIATSLADSVKLLNLYITMSLNKSLEQRQNDGGCREASAEAQRALITVIMVYPDKSAQQYGDLIDEVDKAMWKAVPEVENAWHIRQLIVRLAARIGAEGMAPDTSATRTVPLTTSARSGA